MEALFHLHLWDQSHVTIVWNTRETGDIYLTFISQTRESFQSLIFCNDSSVWTVKKSSKYIYRQSPIFYN